MSRESSARYYQKNDENIFKSLVIGTKIFLKTEKTKNKNMVVNDIKIAQKMTNKSYLSIGKDITKCKKIVARSLYKVSVSSYKSKNVAILRQPRFQFLAIVVGKNATISGQLYAFEINTLNFSIRQCRGRCSYPLFFPNKEIF